MCGLHTLWGTLSCVGRTFRESERWSNNSWVPYLLGLVPHLVSSVVQQGVSCVNMLYLAACGGAESCGIACGGMCDWFLLLLITL